MTTRDEFAENRQRLPPRRKWNQARRRPLNQAWIGRTENECADVKTLRVEPAHDFAPVAHLRIDEVGVGKAIDEYADWIHQ